jgi:hypothetical protein
MALRLKYPVALLLIAVSFGVYLNTLSNGFVHDDKIEFFEDPWIKDI